MMLVVVIAFFLTTEIPLLVITVLHTLDNRQLVCFVHIKLRKKQIKKTCSYQNF